MDTGYPALIPDLPPNTNVKKPEATPSISNLKEPLATPTDTKPTKLRRTIDDVS